MFYQLTHLGTSDYFKKEEGENFSYPPHLHQCFELILVTDGQMDILIDGKEYRLQKNQAVFIFPNQLHSMSSTRSKHVLFIFAPQFIQAYWTEKNGVVPDNNLVALHAHTVQGLLSLSPESSKFEIKGIFYSVCACFDPCRRKAQNLRSRVFFTAFALALTDPPPTKRSPLTDKPYCLRSSAT